MRQTIFVVVTAAFFSVLAPAQDEAQYKEWMKSVPPAVGAIRGAPDNAAAKADATKVADAFDKIAGFWKAKNAQDAVQFAETARDAAKAIAAGDGDKAANLQKIQAQCGSCHRAHRDGAAPDFKIK
jgi:mono/diheme cytochrome c family protein